mgnify:FL=1
MSDRTNTIGAYQQVITPGEGITVVETDIDLYYTIALEMYRRVVENNQRGEKSVFIVPVGPTFQYRRFVALCRTMPIDLSSLHLFFMDEYLEPLESEVERTGVADASQLIDIESPLSFRGFVKRELADPLEALGSDAKFSAAQIHFPDPGDPQAYDQLLEHHGGAEACFAGVGINGHLAFNEPPYPPETADGDAPDFFDRPTRVVRLSRETIAINSNTALGGAWDLIPSHAITVGMRQILASRALQVYLNRPWQRAVVRKMLYGPVTVGFPASAVQNHPAVTVTMTAQVAERPSFGLR